MFESLSDRLSSAFRSLSGRAQLTEENIRDGLREVRLALLEADVNFKVVKEFLALFVTIGFLIAKRKKYHYA